MKEIDHIQEMLKQSDSSRVLCGVLGLFAFVSALTIYNYGSSTFSNIVAITVVLLGFFSIWLNTKKSEAENMFKELVERGCCSGTRHEFESNIVSYQWLQIRKITPSVLMVLITLPCYFGVILGSEELLNQSSLFMIVGVGTSLAFVIFTPLLIVSAVKCGKHSIHVLHSPLRYSKQCLSIDGNQENKEDV